MDATDLTEDLARLAHECWRRRMAAEGWVFGPAYDEVSRRHDALVPWEQLGRWDREEARLAVESLELERLLAEELDYPRGPDRPFTPEEMRAGIRVAWAEGIAQDIAAPGAGPRCGVIESWETDRSGRLTMLRVRWEDGSLSEHLPSERDLRRVG